MRRTLFNRPDREEAHLKPDRPEEGSPRAAWRTDRGFFALFTVAALGIAGVNVFSVFHDRAILGRPLPFWEPAVWELSSGLVLVFLAPGLMWVARRHPPRAPPRFAWLGWHLAAALAFSLIHVLAMGALRWAVYAVRGDWYDPLSPLGDWPYELRKDVLVYAGVTACYVVWRGRERVEVQPRTPSEPSEPIEVRDGARRLFVPVEDILWVEAAGNYVELHRRASPVLHRAPLAQMERRLAGVGFVRIHRSRLVRRDAIAAVETNASGDFTVRLVTGETLSGSRRFRASTRLDRGAAPD